MPLTCLSQPDLLVKVLVLFGRMMPLCERGMGTPDGEVSSLADKRGGGCEPLPRPPPAQGEADLPVGRPRAVGERFAPGEAPLTGPRLLELASE